jgi:hypothetical protein
MALRPLHMVSAGRHSAGARIGSCEIWQLRWLSDDLTGKTSKGVAGRRVKDAGTWTLDWAEAIE